MSLFLLLLGLVSITPAVGLELRVDSKRDRVDAIPGDGVCATADGECSLRAAVEEANAQAGRDAILLPTGVFVLGPVTDDLATGALQVLDDLDITGAGSGETFIDGAGRVPILLISEVAVALRDLTLRNGFVSETEIEAVVDNFGRLSIERCRLTGNEVIHYGATIVNHATLHISDSVLEDNRGLLIDSRNVLVLDRVVLRRNQGVLESSGETPVIRRSEISDNDGGIYGCPVVTDSVLRDNGSAAIACPVSGVVVARSTIADNWGEGINSDGSVWVVDSTITGNSRYRETSSEEATVSGLGVVGNGGIVALGVVRVQRSTMADNFGYGVYSEFGVELDNVTVTGNRDGGVLVDEQGRIDASTIVDNDGPGIWQYFEGELIVRNSIVTGNTADGAAADCRGIVQFAGNNLLGSVDGCDAALDASDRVGVDPMIGPLQDNGGPTFDRAPLDGSPALDGGPEAGAAGCPTLDQRGARRPQGERCDVGAVERLAACGDGSVDVGEDCDDGNRDDGDCCSALCRLAEILVGDCDGDGSVGIEELIFAVGLATNHRLPLDCRAADRDDDLRIGIAELIAAVGNALAGVQTTCP